MPIEASRKWMLIHVTNHYATRGIGNQWFKLEKTLNPKQSSDSQVKNDDVMDSRFPANLKVLNPNNIYISKVKSKKIGDFHIHSNLNSGFK